MLQTVLFSDSLTRVQLGSYIALAHLPRIGTANSDIDHSTSTVDQDMTLGHFDLGSFSVEIL